MTEIAGNSSTNVMQLYDFQGSTSVFSRSSSYIDPEAKFFEKTLENRSGRKRSIFVKEADIESMASYFKDLKQSQSISTFLFPSCFKGN